MDRHPKNSLRVKHLQALDYRASVASCKRGFCCRRRRLWTMVSAKCTFYADAELCGGCVALTRDGIRGGEGGEECCSIL